jgi:hypothetical protein
MLKSLEAAAAVSGLPEGTYLAEAGVGVTCFFTGVRTTMIGGIAHLLFYTEQPGASGDTEYVVVARLAAPEMRAAACLTHAALEIAKGPQAIDRPAN